MLDTGVFDYDLSGMGFTTPARDNDGARDNCASFSHRRGGWWFNSCNHAFLNSQWSPGSWLRPWFPTVRDSTQIKETLMMIKPH
ncbi:angiopoietin-related protein 2-like [Saccostrea cucullata]|uniref:angiopoietin-related protein 2-like n=1 Tax=Saccostrea cuccullata TaxID=36930 RepID=UPI002ED4BE10